MPGLPRAMAAVIYPRKEAIAAVSVTTQRANEVVPMGKDNQPLRPAISWLDQRQVNITQIRKLESALAEPY